MSRHSRGASTPGPVSAAPPVGSSIAKRWQAPGQKHVKLHGQTMQTKHANSMQRALRCDVRTDEARSTTQRRAKKHGSLKGSARRAGTNVTCLQLHAACTICTTQHGGATWHALRHLLTPTIIMMKEQLCNISCTRYNSVCVSLWACMQKVQEQKASCRSMYHGSSRKQDGQKLAHRQQRQQGNPAGSRAAINDGSAAGL